MLKTAGFREVYSMAGGINAWKGLIAAGPPEAGMSFFAGAAEAGELIVLAWLLEEGSRNFYSGIAAMQRDPAVRELFTGLVKAEEKHKASLKSLYRTLTGKEPGDDFPKQFPIGQHDRNRMEGNVPVNDALDWAGGKQTRDILELSISLETDSYDRYIKMSRMVSGEDERRVFERLIAEEKEHLSHMTDLLDKVH